MTRSSSPPGCCLARDYKALATLAFRHRVVLALCLVAALGTCPIYHVPKHVTYYHVIRPLGPDDQTTRIIKKPLHYTKNQSTCF